MERPFDKTFRDLETGVREGWGIRTPIPFVIDREKARSVGITTGPSIELHSNLKADLSWVNFSVSPQTGFIYLETGDSERIIVVGRLPENQRIAGILQRTDDEQVANDVCRLLRIRRESLDKGVTPVSLIQRSHGVYGPQSRIPPGSDVGFSNAD